MCHDHVEIGDDADGGGCDEGIWIDADSPLETLFVEKVHLAIEIARFSGYNSFPSSSLNSLDGSHLVDDRLDPTCFRLIGKKS